MTRRFGLHDWPFADRTGAGVTVAVIDSGVHAEHPHVAGVAEAACVDPAGTDAVDRLGHGTAVAAAIRDLAPGARLIAGKVFDRALATNATTLAAGIDWAVRHGAQIINLSLGTSNVAREDALRDSVARAAAVGALVVSAREANGIAFLPGSLPGVVGVVADPALERDELVISDGVFVAAPYPRPIPRVPKERNLSGVSFAVANVSGFLARLRESAAEVKSVGDVLQALSP